MRPNHNAAVTEHPRGFELSDLEGSSVIAAVATSPSGRVVWANRLFCRLLAAPTEGDILGQKLHCWLADPDAWPTQGRPDRCRQDSVELKLRRNDQRLLILRGDTYLTELENTGPCILGLFTDTTEVEQLRSALRRSARLEAVGSLTSGIAHDFNNLLTVLVGNLSLLAEELRHDKATFGKIKAARDAATRGSDLIRQLLAFAREQPVDSTLINPAKVISRIAPLVDRALGSKIELELDLADENGSIHGNAAQLESVVVNLAVNARDAMESGGKVTVSARDERLDAATAGSYGLTEGNYLRIEVADNGSGIPAETIERVFEPFFSTKLDRGGSGLGLSMVRTYAEHFGGAAVIDSVVNEGTKVSLLFPKSADKLEDSIAMTMPLSTLPTGDEAVLVLAPEEGMRSTVAQILSVLGYDVRTAETLRDANLMMREASPDVLIVDGFDASTLLAAQAAVCRAIQLSTSDEAADIGPSDGLHTLIKPFSLADLAAAVRAALD